MKKKRLWALMLVLFVPFLLLVSIIASQKVEKSNGDIIIRFDDYGVWCNQDWLEIEKDLISVHEKYGIKISFATIPESRYTLNYHPLSPKSYPKKIENNNFNPYPLQAGSERVNVLKESVAKGISEVTLHGFYHPKGYSNNLNTEFYGVPYDVQYYKLQQGKRILDSLFNTNVTTLVPPHNTYDNLTLDLLEDIGYKCISAKQPTITAPISATGNIACLWHTNSDFHQLTDYFEKQDHYINEPTPVLMLHHTSFTNGGGYDSSLMRDYEGFLKILKEKDVKNYHFADVYEDTSFLLKNDHLKKEVYKVLLGIGLSTKVATKLITVDSFIPLSIMLSLLAISLLSLFCGLWFIVILVSNRYLQVINLICSKKVLGVSIGLSIVYALYILISFSKLNLLGWTMLLSGRFLLIYIFLAFVIVSSFYNISILRHGK